MADFEDEEIERKFYEVIALVQDNEERLKSLEAFANKASEDLTFVMTSMIDISHALADVINRLDALENPEETQSEH